MQQTLPIIRAVDRTGFEQGLVNRLQTGKDHDHHVGKLAPHGRNDDQRHGAAALQRPGVVQSGDHSQFIGDPVDHTVAGVRHESPDDRGNNRGDRPRNQHQAAQRTARLDLAVQQKRDTHAQYELDHDHQCHKDKGVLEIGKDLIVLEHNFVVGKIVPFQIEYALPQFFQPVITKAGVDTFQNRERNNDEQNKKGRHHQQKTKGTVGHSTRS